MRFDRLNGEATIFRSWLAILYLTFIRWSVAALHGAGVVALLYEIYGPLHPGLSAGLIFGPIPFVLASAWPTRLIIYPDRLMVVNGLSRRTIQRDAVECFEWRRPPYFLAQPAIAVRLSHGRSVLIAASLVFRDAKRFALSGALSNWLSNPDAGVIRPGRAYKRDFQLLWVGFALLIGYRVAREFMGAVLAGVVAVSLGSLVFPIATKVGAFMQEADIDLGMVTEERKPDE